MGKIVSSSSSKKNRYRFEPFSSRISRAKIKYRHTRPTLGQDGSQDRDNLSYFKSALQRLSELNNTIDYRNFKREVENKAINLASIILNRDDISALMIRYLEIPNNKAIAPLVDLAVSLAKDLEEELTDNFVDIFVAVLKASDTEDVEIAEICFSAATQLVRCISTNISNNPNRLFDMMSEYLFEKKYHIRRFACEAFGFILRRKSNYDFFNFCLYILENIGHKSEGKYSQAIEESCALLFFETFKQIDGHLHILAADRLSELLDAFKSSDFGVTSVSNVPSIILKGLITLLAQYANSESAAIIFRVLFDMVTPNTGSCEIILSAVQILVSINKEISDSNLDMTKYYDILKTIPNLQWNENLSRAFGACLVSFYEKLDRGSFSSFMEEIIGCELKDSEKFLLCFCEIARIKGIDLCQDSNEWYYKFLRGLWEKDTITSALVILSLDLKDDFLRTLNVKNIIEKSDLGDVNITKESANNFFLKISILKILSKVNVPNCDDVNLWISHLRKIFDLIQSNPENRVTLEIASGEILNLISCTNILEPVLMDLLKMVVDIILPLTASNKTVLGSIIGLMKQTLSKSCATLNALFNYEIFEKYCNYLHSTFKSHDAGLRILSLEILSLFEEVLREENELFRKCLEFEKIENNVINSRKKITILNSISVMVESKRLSMLHAKQLAALCISWLGINLSILWPVIGSILVKLAKFSESCFWDVVEEQLEPYANSNFSAISLNRYAESISYLGLISDNLFIRKIDYADYRKHRRSAEKYGLKTFFYHQLTIYMENISSLSIKRIVSDKSEQLILFFINRVMLEQDRVDRRNVFRLILSTMKSLPHLIVRESNLFANIFFKCLDCTKSEEEQSNSSVLTSSTIDMLRMFASVKNPEKMNHSNELLGRYVDILAKGDSELQTEALKCVLTFQIVKSETIKETLLSLCDEKTFRNTIATQNKDNELMSSINEKDGSYPISLSDILVNLLYGKIISKHKRKSGTNAKSKTSIIFSFFVILGPESIRKLMDISFSSFGSIPYAPLNGVFRVTDDLKCSLPTLSKRAGLINFFMAALDKLKNLLSSSTPCLFKIVLCIMASLEETKGTRYKNISKICILLLAKIFDSSLDFDHDPFIPELFDKYLNNKISNIADECINERSGLLHIFGSWARNDRFRSYLLNFNHELLPVLISIIGMKKASPKSINKILVILKFIIDSSNDSDQMKLDKEAVLFNIEMLMNNIFGDTNSLDILSRNNLKLAFQILISISSKSSHSESIDKIVAVSFKLLVKPGKVIPERVKKTIIILLKNYVGKTDKLVLDEAAQMLTDKTSYYYILSGLFRTLKNRESVQELIGLFYNISKISKNIEPVCEVISGISSVSKSALDSSYFDGIFESYSLLNEKYMDKFSPYQWLPILNVLFKDLTLNEEFSIRNTSMCTLKKFITSVKYRLEIKSDNAQEYLDLLKTTVFINIRILLRIRTKKSKSEAIALLEHIVCSIPYCDSWADLRVLLAKNDQDDSFFANIYHMQIHRRAKALMKLANLCRAEHPAFSRSSINGVFLPILNNIITDSDTPSPVLNQSIETLSACASLLTWPRYWKLILSFIKGLETSPDQERIFIRAIGSVISGFNFKDLDEEASKMVRNRLRNVLLPKLYKIMLRKDDGTLLVRLPVSFQISKVLSIIPGELDREDIKRLPIFLSQILCSKVQEVRDKSRVCLVKVLETIGIKYFHMVISDMQLILKRGYQLHVLGYTLNHLISNLEHMIEFKSLDSSLDDIVKICFDDIFQTVGEEKEVKGISSKMVETKVNKSYDTIERISKVIGLESLEILISPVKELMVETCKYKTSCTISKYLQSISKGISSNLNIEGQDIINTAGKILTDNIPFIKLKFADALMDKKQKINVFLDKKRLEIYQANAHLIVDFALSLILSKIKKVIKDGNVKNRISIDSVLEPLVLNFCSIESSSVCLASKILSHIIHIDTPQIARLMPLIKKMIFTILSRYNIDEPIVQTTFKLLAAILRNCPHVNIDKSQLMGLVNVIKVDIASLNSEHQEFTFTLLKELISHNIESEEIKSLSEKVMQLAVNSNSPHIRQRCRHVVLKFLTSYNLKNNEIQKYMLFLLQNLKYVHESGRLSVLDILERIVVEFDKDVLQKFIEILLLSLVVMIVNEDSPLCRKRASDVIKLILVSSTSNNISRIKTLIENWLESDKNELKLAAICLFEICVGSILQNVKSLEPIVRKFIIECLEAPVTIKEDSQRNFQWRLTKEILGVLVAIFKKPELESVNVYPWRRIKRLCLHPHNSIKKISLELVLDAAKNIDYTYLLNPKKEKHLNPLFSTPEAIENLADTVLELFNAHSLPLEIKTILVDLLCNITKIRIASEPQNKDAATHLMLRVKYLFSSSLDSMKFILMYINSIITELEKDQIINILDYIVHITYNITDPELMVQSGSIIEKLQAKVSSEVYLESYKRIHFKAQSRKAEIRAKKAVLAVENPQLAAKLRSKQTLKKKESRKRKKIEMIQNEIFNKKRSKKIGGLIP